MKPRLLLFMMLLPATLVAQTLTRNKFAYEQLKTDTSSHCSDEVMARLNQCFVDIENNNSKDAVRISKEIYQSEKGCPEVYETHAYSLFRSGEWFEGIEIIEKGIEKFGAHPELIKRKSTMSLEMAELGTGQKNIDGSSVYKANGLSYDEEQFKEENLKSALLDLEYLRAQYNRTEDVYYVAKLHQLLKNYDKSTELFKTLLIDDDYQAAAAFNIADNYISIKKYDEAAAEISRLLKEYPREGELYEKMAEIYDLKKDAAQKREFKNKAIFFKNVPTSSSLEYSKDNYDLLLFFATDNKAEKKLERLKNIYKQNNQEYTIDVCLMILKVHANHGNGVEEEATKILARIGTPSIGKVHDMFQSNVSTCTITNLADIMSTVKDEESWTLLVEYLPGIANMPITLTPPSVPEMMVKFDEDKGVREILKVIQPLLLEEHDDVMSGFGQYVYFVPLQKISKSKIRKIAGELNYSAAELKVLEEKIK